jgi:hypothetical protein
MGMARDDIAAGVRHFPVGRYLILYRELGTASKWRGTACAACRICFDRAAGYANVQYNAA